LAVVVGGGAVDRGFVVVGAAVVGASVARAIVVGNVGGERRAAVVGAAARFVEPQPVAATHSEIAEITASTAGGAVRTGRIRSVA